MSEDDPLENLVKDKSEIDRERLSQALEGYINLDGETGELMPTPEFYELSNLDGFILLMLGKIAARNLNLLSEEDNVAVTTEEVSDYLDASPPSIRTYASRLDFVDSHDSGGYYIPSRAIGKALQKLQ